jgi:hypothetical protein
MVQARSAGGHSAPALQVRADSPFVSSERQAAVGANNPGPSVQLRVVVVDPPPGVRFAVQRERAGLHPPTDEQADALRFDFSLRLGAALPDGAFNFLGEFAQGPREDRFVYINSGTLAGQEGSCWTRRAKLKLASIPRPLVEAALGAPGGVIEARIPGTMGDGGPVCASIKPQAVAWRLVHERG